MTDLSSGPPPFDVGETVVYAGTNIQSRVAGWHYENKLWYFRTLEDPEGTYPRLAIHYTWVVPENDA